MLLIFDLDGVLVHASWEGLFEAYKALIGHEGQNWEYFFRDLDEFKDWWNPNWHENEKRLGILDLDMSHKIFYEVAGHYYYLMLWVGSMLKMLSKKYKLAIFTNRHRKSALEYLGSLKHLFSIIVAADDVENLKPHPEGINLILKKTNTKPQDVLMIGDRPEDLEAGAAAGTKIAAVIWEHGLGREKDFNHLELDYIFRTAESFLTLLL